MYNWTRCRWIGYAFPDPQKKQSRYGTVSSDEDRVRNLPSLFLILNKLFDSVLAISQSSHSARIQRVEASHGEDFSSAILIDRTLRISKGLALEFSNKVPVPRESQSVVINKLSQNICAVFQH